MCRENATVNNQATVIGEITSAPVFSHATLGDNFYRMEVSCPRLSGYHDVIPVTMSDRLVDMEEMVLGRTVCVSGQFYSCNLRENGKARLVLSVAARTAGFLKGARPDPTTNNQIFLDGYLCRMPVYRKTPLGREITDLMLAVNRSYNRSDYIPCVVWGRNARYAGTLPVGARVMVQGRIQSRSYIKKLPDGTAEERMAFEMSVHGLQLVEESGKMEAEG